HAADAVAGSQLGLGIGFQPSEARPCRQRGRRFIEDWCEQAAGTAPGRPEIDHDRQIVASQVLLGIGPGQLEGPTVQQPLLAATATAAIAQPLRRNPVDRQAVRADDMYDVVHASELHRDGHHNGENRSRSSLPKEIGLLIRYFSASARQAELLAAARSSATSTVAVELLAQQRMSLGRCKVVQPARDSIEAALKQWSEPHLQKDLVSADAIRDLRVADAKVVLEVELGFPAAGYRDVLAQQLAALIRDQTGVAEVE